MSDIITVLAPAGPGSLSELTGWIRAGFAAFHLPAPDVRQEQVGADVGPVIVTGFGVVDECRISVTAGQTGVQIVIETRMGWQQAAFVAYGICNQSGGTLRNDAQQFDRQPAYTADALKLYIDKSTYLTPAAARESLRAEAESLAQGAIHPDMLAWLFIREMTRLQDVTLMDMAPSDVQDRIRAIVSEFQRDGDYILYTRKGPIDHSRALRELVRLLAAKRAQEEIQ